MVIFIQLTLIITYVAAFNIGSQVYHHKVRGLIITDATGYHHVRNGYHHTRYGNYNIIYDPKSGKVSVDLFGRVFSLTPFIKGSLTPKRLSGKFTHLVSTSLVSVLGGLPS